MSDYDYDLDDLMEEEAPKKKKKKKWWVGLLVFFLVVGVLVGVPVGFVYIVLADQNHEELVIDTELNPQRLGEKLIVDAFDSTMENGQISIDLHQDDLNSIISNNFADVTTMTKGIVKQLYFDIDGNKYHIYCEIEVKEIKFNTRLDITMILEETEEAFILRIDEISVGKLRKLEDMVKKVVTEYIPNLDLNGIIAKSGLTMELDLDAKTLTYRKDDLLNDIRGMIPADNTLFGSSIDMFLNEKYLSFDTNRDTFLSAFVNLDIFKENSLYSTNDDEHLIFGGPTYEAENPGKDELAEFVKPKLDSLIEAGIASELTHLEPLFRLYFVGYQQLNDSEKSIVNSLYNANPAAFQETGISDLSTYTGARNILTEEELLSSTIEEIQAAGYERLLEGKVGRLYERDINAYIANSPIIGFTTLLSRYEGDQMKYNYIVIDNFYCNIMNNEANFVCGLNLNGFDTNIIFHMPVNTAKTSGVHITFEIADIFFGEENVEGLEEVLFAILDEALEGDESLVIDKENHEITINMQTILDETNRVLTDNSLPSVSEDKFSIAAVGENLAAQGYIDISLASIL